MTKSIIFQIFYCVLLCLYNITFKEQVLYFNNAKLIICAHGAVMSNMFFCKERTKIIEVTCDFDWMFFNQISKILNLQHIKCMKNNFNEVINYIKMNEIYPNDSPFLNRYQFTKSTSRTKGTMNFQLF